MKKNVIKVLILTSLVLGAGLLINQGTSVSEKAYDLNNEGNALAIKTINVGSNENVDLSRTYAQMGLNPISNNRVLRFATAISGPVSRAYYTRVATGFPQETLTTEVNVLYAGILAEGESTYYDGQDLTTTRPVELQYYWAVYTIEFETETHVETDITVYLTVEGEEGEVVQSTSKVASLSDYLEKNSVNLSLPSGVSVSSYNQKQTAGEVLSLPSENQVSNETGRAIVGWYDVSTKSLLNETSLVPEDGITIAPVFGVRENHIKLDIGDEQSSRKPQIRGEGTAFSASFFNSEKHKTVIEGNDGYASLGSVVGNDGVIPQGGMFRLNTKVSTSYEIIDFSAEHQFEYNFHNYGENPIKLKLNQVNSAALVEENDEGFIIDLQPGESVNKLVEMRFTLGTPNKNALTLLTAVEECVDMRLGISLSYGREINYSNMRTLSIDGAGATFENGETSIQIPEGKMLPGIVGSLNGRELVGAYINNNKYVGTYYMGNEDLMITPVFGPQEGFTNLVLGSEQGSNRTVQVKDSTKLTVANFSIGADRGIVVGGGETGVKEFGTLISYNGSMPKGALFRYLTKVSSVFGYETAVMTLNTNHSFAYNFENKGTTDIHLKLNQVNSSYTVESGDAGVAIDLAPGESMHVTFTMKFAVGSANKNTMSMFTVAQQMDTGFALGVSFSIKVGGL